MTDLLYTEEEEALRSAVRDLLRDHCDPAGVIARTETDTPHDLALWKSLADGMGLAGLLVPEELGGQGATHREAAVVLEELGRAVASGALSEQRGRGHGGPAGVRRRTAPR
ncbi:alkylation response protein AidB-like acyl-CoA dehydrogenase [Streptomyces sp. SAI-170]